MIDPLPRDVRAEALLSNHRIFSRRNGKTLFGSLLEGALPTEGRNLRVLRF